MVFIALATAQRGGLDGGRGVEKVGNEEVVEEKVVEDEVAAVVQDQEEGVKGQSIMIMKL